MAYQRKNTMKNQPIYNQAVSEETKFKLTAVTVTYKGNLIQCFVQLPIINGKAVLTRMIHEQIIRDLKCRPGSAYSIG